MKMKMSRSVCLMVAALGISGVAAAQGDYTLEVRVEAAESGVKSSRELRSTLALDAAGFVELETNRNVPFKATLSEDSQGLITAAFTICHPARQGCDAVSRPVLSFSRGQSASFALRGADLAVRIDLKPVQEPTG